jgi:GDP-4-dehydro-6-deoxy-D-mannose reductase
VRTLVTGADGFVGQHLVRRLLEQGQRVSAAALTLPPSRTILSSSQMAAVDWKAADVTDPDALYRLVAAVQPDGIYHFAGFSSGARARDRADRAMEVNAGGTVNLCDAVRAVQKDFPQCEPRILIAGAGDSYGESIRAGTPVREDAQLRPVTAFGLSKACQEMVAHTYRRAYGLDTVVGRGFNLIGPGQEPGFVVPDFCRQVAAIVRGEQEPVMHVGNLDVERDFTDVRDGVRAFHLLMEASEAGGAYNVSSGRAVAVGRLLEWILDEANVDPEIRTDADLVRKEEVPWQSGDPGRLRDLTGWEPEHDLEKTVRAVYRWILDQE